MNLDFDQMKDMSPEELATYKDRLIEEFISSVPEDKQQRLRQFQWKLDGELRKYKDPTARMNKMIELFWLGVAEFSSVMNDSAEKLNR